MRKIIFTTESGADLPKDLAEKYNVQVVPMHVILEGKDYLDGTLAVEDIFDYHNRTKKIPSTTATNPHEYEEFFTKIRENNPDCIIIHIGYTSKASASFHGATIAAENFDNLYLIDALNVASGLTAVVMYAVKLLENEPNIEPSYLIEKIEAIVPKSRMAFVPGSLDFLKAGGRVSNAVYLGGSLLKLKPCIELIEGKLVSTKKYRGKMSVVVEKLMQDYLTEYDINREQIYLQYSLGLDESVKQLAERLAIDAGFKNITWIQAGAMITTHAGPGGFGVAGLERI